MPTTQTYPAKVLLFVPDEQSLLDAGYDRIAVERRKHPSYAWAEITDSSTELRIEVGTYNYFYLDEEAEPGWQYRPVLRDSSAVAADTPQSVVAPIDASYEYVLTIQELKDLYLFGLGDALSNDQGIPIPDYAYAHYIKAAISRFEQKTSVRVMPKFFEEYHDFFEEDAATFFSMFLDEYPVIQVDKIELTLPGSSPQSFPSDWLRLEKLAGQIHMIPGSGEAPWVGLRNRMVRGARSDKFIPQAFKVSYFAGFAPGEIPDNIKDIIGKQASFGPLNIGGDLLGGAGIASQTISLDGLSTTFNTTSSATNAGFGARITQYTKELKEAYPDIIRYFKGLRMKVL